MQPEEHIESGLININEESSCAKKDEDVLGGKTSHERQRSLH